MAKKPELIAHEPTNQISFTPEQVELIKSQIAVGASNDELQLFLYQAQKTGLDPFARQIYFIKRGGRGTIQTSIDGFRVVAERSGKYAGQDEPKFEEDNGKLVKCTVTVYKFSENGTRYPAASGVAYWNEYAQQTPLWAKMPHTMLAKCAESVALRKAFPQDLSGLYTGDEMEQAEAPVIEQVTNTEPAAPIVDRADVAELRTLVDDRTQAALEKKFGPLNEMSEARVKMLIGHYGGPVSEAEAPQEFRDGEMPQDVQDTLGPF